MKVRAKNGIAVGFVLVVMLLSMGVAAQEAKARTVVKVWDWWASTPAVDEYFAWVEKEFEQRNPDIDVQYEFYPWAEYREKLITSAAAGIGPDVAQISINFARELYDGGLLMELNSFIERSPSTSPDQFVPVTQRYNQKDGRIYGVPYVMDSAALVYNTDHFNEAGISIAPFALETWEDFLRAAQKLVRRDSDTITRSGYGYWPNLQVYTSWLYSNGGSFYNSDERAAAFNDERGRETLEFLSDLQVNYAVYNPDAASLPAGNTSMAHMGTWSGPYIADQGPEINFAMTSYPQGPSGEGRGTTTWSNMIALFRGAENTDAAWRFVEFITSLEVDEKLLTIMDRPTSPRLDYYQSDVWGQMVFENPWMRSLPEIAMVGGAYPFLNFTEINAIMTPMVQKVAFGESAPQEVITNAERAVNQILRGGRE